MLSKSFGRTQKIAADLTNRLSGGEIFGLVGNLGSGKTAFVQGIAKGLGVKEKITSPTFVILKEYRTSKKFSLVHIDLYRLKTLQDVLDVGLADYLGKKDKVCLIEWADKIKNYLPKKSKIIKFKFIDKNTREINIKE